MPINQAEDDVRDAVDDGEIKVPKLGPSPREKNVDEAGNRVATVHEKVQPFSDVRFEQIILDHNCKYINLIELKIWPNLSPLHICARPPSKRRR